MQKIKQNNHSKLYNKTFDIGDALEVSGGRGGELRGGAGVRSRELNQ